MIKWIGLGWLLFLLAGCTVDKTAVPDRVCLLTQSTDRPQNSDGSSTNRQETISYNGGQLQTFSRQTSTENVSFSFTYLGGQVAQAYTADKMRQLNLEYDEAERIAKASFVVNNKEQALFSLYYNDSGRRSQLQRLVETRTLITDNSFIASRTFEFGYDASAGEVYLQNVQNGLKNGTRSEEELTFTFNKNYHSPYYDQDQRIVLALTALTDTAETTPIRFLQRYEVSAWERRSITTNGSSTLRETSSFSIEHDGNFNPTQRTQTTTTLPGNSTKRFLQTFQYDCTE